LKKECFVVEFIDFTDKYPHFVEDMQSDTIVIELYSPRDATNPDFLQIIPELLKQNKFVRKLVIKGIIFVFQPLKSND